MNRLRQYAANLFCIAFAVTACNRDAKTESAPTVPPSSAVVAASSAPAEPSVDGLRYIEQMAGGAAMTDDVPIVIAMHGLGDRPESFGRIFDGIPIRMRLILPYAPLDQGSGFSWFRVNGFKPEALAEGSKTAAGKVVQLMAELKKSRPSRGKPIVTGFSQGGMLSFALAVLFPDQIAEALPVAGLLARPLHPSSWPKDKPMPKITAFHGNADDIVPLADDSESVKVLSNLGFSATLTEYPNVRHGVSAEMRRDWFAALAEAVERAKGP